MMKIEKEKKFKREYIPVILGSIILILFFVLLVLTINYDGNIKKEDLQETNAISETDDLAVDKTNSKCSQDVLNKLVNSANQVGAEYYVDEERIKVDPSEVDEYYYSTLDDGYETNKIIAISISGITDDVYVRITNSFDDTTWTIRSSDLNEDGKYIFKAVDMLTRVTYTVSIYSNNPDCQEELLRKTTFKTKIFNNFSLSMACVAYPKYENCVELVDKEIDAITFTKGYAEYEKNNDPNQEKANVSVIKAMAASEGASDETLNNIEETITNQKSKKENAVLAKLNENKELIIISITIIAIGILIIVLLMFIRRNKI